MEVLYRRNDGTFVAVVNGYPYHVVQSDPLYQEASEVGADAPIDPMQSFIPTPSLSEKRSGARLDRGDLCKGLLQAGILAPNSAIVAAKGDWPSEFDSFLLALPSEQRVPAQIEWAAATTVRYTNPLLQSAALNYVSGNSVAATALLDTLFGLT